MAWAFRDEATDASRKLLTRAASVQFLVLGLWHIELGTALLQAERRKRLAADESAEFLDLLSDLSILTDDESCQEIPTRLMNIARRHRLTSYDATYLDVAIRHGAALATRDDDLRRAGHAEGLVLVAV